MSAWTTRTARGARARGPLVDTLLPALLLSVLSVGCGVAGPPEAPDRSPAPPPTSPTAPASPTGSDPAEETLEEDVRAAAEVVNGYWAAHWDELFTGSYRPPRVLGDYDGSARRVPACAGEPLADDNAVYCGAQDYIAWDVDLMAAGHKEGDAWVYLVIAHEWGHAVQNRLDRQLISLAAELQADCLAGAVLFGAAKDGTLQFEDGDTEELTRALTVLADDTPWTDAGDHGDAGQRVGSFARGRERGVGGCLPE